MNERIKQLAIQAGFFYEDYKDIWYLEYHNETCEEEMKKFAELIIRECLSCNDAISPQDISDNNEDWETVDLTLTFAEKKIKEHFGIE